MEKGTGKYIAHRTGYELSQFFNPGSIRAPLTWVVAPAVLLGGMAATAPNTPISYEMDKAEVTQTVQDQVNTEMNKLSGFKSLYDAARLQRHIESFEKDDYAPSIKLQRDLMTSEFDYEMAANDYAQRILTDSSLPEKVVSNLVEQWNAAGHDKVIRSDYALSDVNAIAMRECQVKYTSADRIQDCAVEMDDGIKSVGARASSSLFTILFVGGGLFILFGMISEALNLEYHMQSSKPRREDYIPKAPKN